MRKTLFVRTVVCFISLLGVLAAFQSCDDKITFQVMYIAEAESYSPNTVEAGTIANAIVNAQKSQGLLNKPFWESMDGEYSQERGVEMDTIAAKKTSNTLMNIDFLNALAQAGITKVTIPSIRIRYSFGYPRDANATTVTAHKGWLIVDYDLSALNK